MSFTLTRINRNQKDFEFQFYVNTIFEGENIDDFRFVKGGYTKKGELMLTLAFFSNGNSVIEYTDSFDKIEKLLNEHGHKIERLKNKDSNKEAYKLIKNKDEKKNENEDRWDEYDPSKR